MESFGSASSNLSSFDLTINEDSIGGSSSERPIGLKKGKGKRKKDKQLSRIIQQNEQLVEIFTKGNSDLQQCQATQIQKAEVTEFKEENKILFKYLSFISDLNLRDFFCSEQIRIMQKRSQGQGFPQRQQGEGFHVQRFE